MNSYLRSSVTAAWFASFTLQVRIRRAALGVVGDQVLVGEMPD
jgi:hypothetical protein